MICLQGQTSREMAQALLSVSRRCEVGGARLCFVGSESGLERVRLIARDSDLAGIEGLGFQLLPHAGQPVPEAAWGEAVGQVVLALGAIDRTVPTVAWVEAPVPTGAPGAGLRYLREEIRAPIHGASPFHALLLAFERGSLDEAVRASLHGTFGTSVDASVLLPECPGWFLQAGAGAPAGLLADVGAEKHFGVGQLGAVIAHELGNPLSIISSSLQYLHERLVRSGDDASEFASAALVNVERIQLLLRRMLEAGAPSRAAFQRTSLNEVLPDLLRLTAPEFERNGITVGASFDGRLPRTWLDPEGLKQLVLNLLKNGLDALADGGGSLSVRTRLAEGGDQMTLEVENDGPPLDPDMLPLLFRPFHSTKTGGTGLGLYLSRQIARDHGGDLIAENLPTTGVRFTLLLPVDRRKRGDLGADPDRR